MDLKKRHEDSTALQSYASCMMVQIACCFQGSMLKAHASTQKSITRKHYHKLSGEGTEHLEASVTEADLFLQTAQSATSSSCTVLCRLPFRVLQQCCSFLQWSSACSGTRISALRRPADRCDVRHRHCSRLGIMQFYPAADAPHPADFASRTLVLVRRTADDHVGCQ